MTTLYDEIRRAIGHPSGITPRLPGEPPSTWQARAVVERLEALEAEWTDGEEEGGMLDRIAQAMSLYPEMVEDQHVRPLADTIHATTVRPAIRRLTRERDHLRESTNTAEAERDQLKAAIICADEALESAHAAMVFSSADWSLGRDRVWLYGLIVGWGCDRDHEGPCDDICGGDGALNEVTSKYGWDPAKLALLHQAIADLRRLAATFSQPEEV